MYPRKVNVAIIPHVVAFDVNVRGVSWTVILWLTFAVYHGHSVEEGESSPQVFEVAMVRERNTSNRW